MRTIEIIATCPYCNSRKSNTSIKGSFKIIGDTIYIHECTECLKIFGIDIKHGSIYPMKCTNGEGHNFSITKCTGSRFRKLCPECGVRKLEK